MTGPNGHRDELEEHAAASAILGAAIDEAVDDLKAETSFATMLMSMGDSIKELMADFHKLEVDHLKARGQIEARLQRIAKALGAK